MVSKGGSLVLDNATLKVSAGSFDGALTVGAGGAAIEYPWNDSSTGAFTQSGFVFGSSADSLFKLVGHKHTMNLTGGAALAGRVEVGNGLTLNITKDASFGALVNEATVGDQSCVVVDAATLKLTGSGSNFGTNGNPGNIELTNGGVLQLSGLADGSSMGALGTLSMGTDGVLTLASFAAYTGSNALMSIATIEGTRRLQIELESLDTLADGATYHLLSSANELSGWTLLNATASGSRQVLELVSGGAEGAYTLDLKVTGAVAAATWKGTGTLVAGQANATNITTNLAVDDNSFMSMDALTITSDAGSNDTLTLGGEINASALTYTGAGTVTLAQQDGGSFAAGAPLVIDGTGMLALGDATVISGAIELRQGTLSASSTSLNGTQGVRVTGDANFELTSASHVTAGIDIAKGKSLSVSFKADSMASQWGGNFDNNLSGEGCLKLNIGSGKELHLNGDHSDFAGSIEVQSGTLQLGMREDNNQLLSSTLGVHALSMASGTTLSLSASATTLAADVEWAGGSTLHVKDGVESGIAFTLSGTQTLGGALTISAAANRTVQISGGIEGVGSLNFTGASSFILSGNNSYSGGTTLNNSGLTLYAANQNALGTGAVKLQNGSTLSWKNVGNGWNGDLAASGIEVSGGSLNSNGYDVTYSGPVSGSSGSLRKTGAGTLELSQFSYGGATHVAEGTLALGIGKSSWYTGFSGDAGATLRLTSTSPYGTYLMGAISGGVSVELSGDFGYVAANTHTGGTTLLSGSLEIGNVAALQSGPLHAHKGTTVSLVMEKTYMAGESVVDALSFASGSSVLVGADSAAGHLSFGSLSGTASFLLDVFSAASYDRLSGTLTPGSLLAVDLKASELGSYLLVAGDNSGFDPSTITLTGSTNAEHLYLWSHTAQGLTLTIESASLAADANFWVGGSSGTWDASTTPWHGGSYSAERQTCVLAHADTAINVAAAVSATTLHTEVDADATLRFSKSGEGSITATTLQKDGEGTLRFEGGSAHSFGSVVVNEGTLSVADGSALGTTSISGNGTLELTGGSIRADLNAGAMTVKNIRLHGGAVTLHSTAYWGTSITGRSVEILGEGSSLSLEKWANLNASAVILRDGGTLRTGENGLGNDGGTIYVDGAGTIAVGNTGGGDIAAAISGTGTLKVQDWNTGHWVSINGVVADAAGAAAPLALELSQNYVVMKAENSYSGGTTITAGHVIVSNASALGAGGLHMTGGSLTMETTFRSIEYSSDLNIGSLSGTAGAIETGANALHINQTQSGTFAGGITGAATITKAGRGELNLTGANLSAKTLVVEGGVLNVGSISLSTDSLAMTQAGTALNIDSLTLTADAVTLAYSSVQSNVSIGTLIATGTLTLSLDDSLESYLSGKMSNGLHNILDLGADLSACTSNLAVTGLGIQAGQYTIGYDASTGHSTLQLRPDSSLAWDANWGITGAPATGEHVSLSATTAFAGQSAYDNGTRIVVGVVGTDGATPLNLFATTAEGATLSRAAWVEVEGGSFGVIAGAGSNTAAANITGDIHVMMSGGTANDVVGFTQQTTHGSTLTGSTYISIGEGATIHDSVIGGGVMTHGQSIHLTGSTNVWVYDVLAAAPESLSGDATATLHNAVIGGHAHGSGKRQEWTIGGSTHVTVDVSAYAGEAAMFGKAVYGGNVSNGQWGSIAGGTNVALHANDKVSFSENIVAGSYNYNSEGQVTIGSNATLTINGGVYGGAESGKFITGGSLLEGSKSVLSGTASVTINGGSINRDVFGAGVNRVGSSTVGSSAVTIGGTACVADDVAAGGKVESGSISISGNSTLRVNGGSLDGGADMYLTGGSVVSGGSSTITGTASVILAGGSINQNVYAAGINNSGAASMVGATRVEIGKDASLGAVTISGGYGGNNTGSSIAQIAGTRTLSLGNGVNLMSSTANFREFDLLEVASGTASLNSGSLAMYDYTKTGAGTLELGGSAGALDKTLNIQGGMVKLASTTALSSSSTVVGGVVNLYSGTLDINGQQSYHNAYLMDVEMGYISFRGEGNMLVKDSSGSADSGLGFYTANPTHSEAYAQAVTYRGTGRAEISANIVNGGQANPSNKMRFDIDSANKGAAFTELTLSGNIGADHSAAERYMFGLAKEGAGAMLLSGNNGYAGGTDVRGGTLIAASDTALGTGALAVSSGATLEIAAGKHLALSGAISFDDGSTLKLHGLDASQAALATTGGWTLGGSMNLHIGFELKAGVEYMVLSGLGAESGIAVTGQEGYRYTYTTSLRDGVYYITASDYEAGELTWAGSSSEAVWSAGEQLWTTEAESGSAQASVGSASKDTVIFGAEGTKDVTVADAGVVVEAVQVTAGQDYCFEGGSVQANEVKVSEGSSMSHGAVYTVSQKDASVDATIGKVEMASDSAAGAGSIRGQEGAEIAGLDNTVIEIAMGGKSLSLQDVMLKDTSSVAGLDGSASLAVDNVTLELGAGNTEVVAEAVTLAGSALLETGGTGHLALGEETKVYSIYSSALASVFVTGSSLTLDLSALTADMLVDVEFADYVAIRFGNGVDHAVAFEAAALSIKASYGGKEATVFYLAADETQRRAAGAAMPDTLYVASSLFKQESAGGGVEAVPEPTTATLSLLALSMLAARRRRR